MSFPDRYIDGQRVPCSELYGDTLPVAVFPIGVVREYGANAEPLGAHELAIHLLPTMAPFLVGVADETHILVLWYFHEVRSVETVSPRGWDGKLVGPFASRTPHRLTPIGVSEVPLVRVEGTILVVRQLDALEGSPVLDVKVGLQSLKARQRSECIAVEPYLVK